MMIQTAAALSILATLLSLAAGRWPIAYRAALVCVAGVAVCLLADLMA